MFDVFDRMSEFIKQIILEAIHSNLKSMFVDLNDKVGTVASEIGKTPMTFNLDVFNFIKNINDNVVIPVAGLIITAVLCVELINIVMKRNSMHDIDTFDFFKYIIKMWVAVWFVSHAFTFSMAVFELAGSLVNKAAGVINTSATISSEQLLSMVDALKDKAVGELVMILFETLVIKILIQLMSLIIMLVVYGRIFEIYIYCSISPIPFATMGNKEWGSIGVNYVKGLFSIGLQGVFLIICLGIYAVLIKSINITDIHTSIFSLLGTAVLLSIMMLKSGSLAKSILNAH